MKLLPYRPVLCTPYKHITMHHITSCKATCRLKVQACLPVTCHLSSCIMTGIFFYCGNTGVERVPKEEPVQKVDAGEENSSAAHAGTRTRDFPIMSTRGTVTTELSTTPSRYGRSACTSNALRNLSRKKLRKVAVVTSGPISE